MGLTLVKKRSDSFTMGLHLIVCTCFYFVEYLTYLVTLTKLNKETALAFDNINKCTNVHYGTNEVGHELS